MTTDDIKSGRLSAKHDLELGPLTSVEFGFNRTNRSKNRDQNEGNLVVGTGPYGSAPVPGTDVVVTPQSGIPVVAWNTLGSIGSIYQLLPKVDQPIQTDKNWDVSEKVSTGYLMGNLEGELFGLSYRGNIGGQYIHTNQSSTGTVVDTAHCAGVAGQACPAYVVQGHHSYNDFLPSMNLGFELPHDQMLRLGLGKTLSRTKMSDLRPGGGVSLNTTYHDGPILSGSAGNPNLEPFRAKALDVSWEKYFTVNGAKGYVAVAGFYKKLDTYVLTVPKSVDFATTGLLSAKTPLPASGPFAGSTVGILNTPVNGTGGNIKGIELSASLPFAMLTKYLNGFGVEVNHSSTLSSVNLLTTGLTVIDTGGVSTIPLPGLSRQVTNLRLYFEKYGLQVAVARRDRSAYLGSISDYQDKTQLVYVKAESQLDLQAAYDFDWGFLKGFSILAQANNLTNSEYAEYDATNGNVTNRKKFGKSYLVGLNYKF